MTDERTFQDAVRSIRLGFFLMGLPIGALVPRLAEIKQGLGASSGSYGTAIAIGGLGSLAGNYIGLRLVHRFGTRRVIRISYAFLLLANVSNALAPSVFILSFVSMASGLSYSLTNIAINSQGVIVEQNIKRSFMPSAHGSWSLGTTLFAIISAVAAPYCTPLQALLTTATICAVSWVFVTRGLLSTEHDEIPHADPTQLQRHERVPRTALKFLAVIACAQWLGLIAEISVGDWSSVLLRENFHVAIGPNGYAFACFMAVQLVTRLGAPRVIDRLGLNRVVRTLGIFGAIGYTVFLIAANAVHQRSVSTALVFACISAAFMALGVAVMPPAFTTAAGGIPGLPTSRALMITGSMMSSLNVAGRIGLAYFAQLTTLPTAMALMGVALLAASLMTSVLHPERGQQHAFVR